MVNGQKGQIPERPIPKRLSLKGYQKIPLWVTRKAHLLISHQKRPHNGDKSMGKEKMSGRAMSALHNLWANQCPGGKL